jgi:uncharacterized protein (TIGR01777 family)
MRVVIAGASGFLGTHLTEHLRAHGHEVVRLVRRAVAGRDESQWDPAAGRVDRKVVVEADAVVNLAGASIAGNPHSTRWRHEVLASRVDTTTLLSETIASAQQPPAFMAGSGISWYGDHGREPLTEEADSRGDAFLTEVARAWEASTAPAREAGARVCVLRTAPVMDRTVAPLKPMRLAWSLGLGARLGDGTQRFPVISLRDWVGAVSFLLDSQDVSGTFNMCCPQTPTNSEFTKALGEAVGRPTFLRAPAAVLRAAVGPMAPELLGSVNARPAALQRAGYDFHDEDVAEVLAAALA